MNENNHYIPYSCQSIDNEDIKCVIESLKADLITTGLRVSEFEDKIANFSNASYATVVSSGTAALHAVMFAIGIKPGDEVILPAISFISTANAVVFQGGTPVFCDVNPDNLLIDVEEVEKKINDNTVAIIGVDYAGHPCDYELLRNLADKHSLVLAIDSCHSLGASYCGKKVGEYADLAVYSFHPVKGITTGEGGAVVTSDQNYNYRCKIFRNHGITQDFKERKGWYYEMCELGYNYRITDFQCALGISQLKKLPNWIERKLEIADLYKANLHHLARPLKNESHVVNAYHLYVVHVPRRDMLFRQLRENNVGVNVHYMPIYMHPFYQKITKAFCPVAESCYNTILSLPMFPTLSNKDIFLVIDLINKEIMKNDE